MKTTAQWVDTVANLSADAEALWVDLLGTSDGALDIETEMEEGVTLVSIQELVSAGLAECCDDDDEDCSPETEGATLVVSEAYLLEVGR